MTRCVPWGALVLGGLWLAGCGGSDSSGLAESGSLDPACPEPSGTYWVDYTKVSGDCADVADGLLNANSNNPACVDTRFTSEKMPAGTCKYQEEQTCTEGGVQVKGIAVYEMTPDGASFQGTMTVTGTQLQNNQRCRGSYQLVGTKQ